MYRIYLLLFFFQLCENTVIQTVVQATKKSWTDASNSDGCVLAGGTLGSGVTLDSLTFNVSGVSFPVEESWIGATVTYSAWIDFQGCYYGKEIKTSERYDITTSSDAAGACLKHCGYSTYYLTSQWCYCPSSVEFSASANLRCNVAVCSGNTICGNEEMDFQQFTYHCMCKYDPFLLSNDDSMAGACKVVYHNDVGVTLTTEDCANTHPVLCHVPDGNRYIPGGHTFTWIDGANHCYAENAQMVGNEGANIMITGVFNYWIGVFRVEQLTWEVSHSGTPNYCLSASIAEDGKAKGRVQSCDTLLQNLCEVSVPTSTQETSTGFGNQTYETTSLSSVVESTTTGTTTSVQLTSVAPVSATENKAGLIVGVIFAVLIGLALIAIMHYFIKRRRRKQQQADEKKKFNSLNKLPHSLRRAGEDNKLSFMDQGNAGHLYNDLNELRHSQSQSPDMYDHTKSGMESTEMYSYDVLHKKGDRETPEGTTPYDTMANINAQEEGGYSTALDLQRAAATLPKSDPGTNMYDTLEKTANK